MFKKVINLKNHYTIYSKIDEYKTNEEKVILRLEKSLKKLKDEYKEEAKILHNGLWDFLEDIFDLDLENKEYTFKRLDEENFLFHEKIKEKNKSGLDLADGLIKGLASILKTKFINDSPDDLIKEYLDHVDCNTCPSDNDCPIQDIAKEKGLL